MTIKKGQKYLISESDLGELYSETQLKKADEIGDIYPPEDGDIFYEVQVTRVVKTNIENKITFKEIK